MTANEKERNVRINEMWPSSGTSKLIKKKTNEWQLEPTGNNKHKKKENNSRKWIINIK